MDDWHCLIAPFLLPKVLPILREQFPSFQLNVVEEQTERLLEKVRYGSIDTAIIALPYSTEGLLSFEFWSEIFLAVFNPADPHAYGPVSAPMSLPIAQFDVTW